MCTDLNSCESTFVSRVAAMESNLRTSDSDMPTNPILAAQRIVNTASALAQINERLAGSPLRQEVTHSAPMLKRNYGSLNLSKMSSSSSSSASSSSLSTPISARFPMYETPLAEDEDDIMEQDFSPASSPSNSPVLEFSTRGQFSHEPEPLGVTFGPNSFGFVSDDEASAYFEFMDTLEDCDSLGRFTQMVETSKLAIDLNTTQAVPTLEPWHREPTIGFLSANLNDSYSACVTESRYGESITMDSFVASPTPLFDAASPRMTQDSWGQQSLVLSSEPWVQVASPAAGSESFMALQWIPAITLVVLIANLVMRSIL
ncbi:hypothetical protein RSOLAG22IIIB_04550 [Rhizoctonia solani]|uniref:Uncharacterized protein n=1 Tax=Rhizoctonia solani TaxID=456999 RepID=A0A0K6FY96_9AGAM|nr:hypothetical protein RSOLAG22IIIB_04550 [Rhizoctonia solani]